MNIYKIVAFIGLFFFSSQESYSQSLSQILEQTNLYTVKIQNSIERPFTGDNYGGSGTGFLVNKKKRVNSYECSRIWIFSSYKPCKF